MRQFRNCSAACLLLLVRGVLAFAGEFYSIGILGKESSLGVEGGIPRLVSARQDEYGWDVSGGGAENTMEIKVKQKGYRGYLLGYDLKGKAKDKPEVTLLKERGAATRWTFTKKRSDCGDYTGDYIIQAASGQYKGWYLCAEEKAEEIKDDNGKKAKSYRLILVEKPKKIPVWDICLVSP